MTSNDPGSSAEPTAPGKLLFPAIIEFLTGPLHGHLFVIEQASTTIGRDPANDITVRGDAKVSRRHARIIWKAGTWSIENSSRSSFIRVNGRQVPQAILADGATVHLGDDSSFTFRLSQTSDAPTEILDHPPAHAPQAAALATPGEPTLAPAGAPAAPHAPKGAAPLVAADERALREAELETRNDETQIASLLTLGIPSLEITSTADGEQRVHVLSGAVINIGRDPINEIVIPDRIISGQHLRLMRQGADFVLVHPHPDRPSTLNGLLYQGRKIRGDESFTRTLADGDLFRIGDDHGALVTLTYHDGRSMPAPALPPLAPIKLDASALTIGRAPDNTVVLDHPQVSSHHARLSHEGAGYRISDLRSTNHVYVNGEVISGQNGHLLKTGDTIRIGPYRLVYQGNQLAQYDESSFVRVDALGLKKYGLNHVTLLDDISLTIMPRAFVALVGGSGAGKSTLLDALNGLRPAQQGRVLYNGQDYYQNLAAFSSQLGYVPQDDIVHRDLTVERALYYAARIRLPSDYSDEQIQQRVGEVLEEVELASRRSLLVRKLSGGQRKRVSIALELLANPSVFFLDEPTSGLDPGLDRKMMTLLRRLADRGHTVVLVTHATTNINACDYVCFLCAGGRLAYFGPPMQAKTYFGKSDFAEIYSSLEPTEENPRIPEEAEARFRASPEYQQYVAGPLRQGPPGTAALLPAEETPPMSAPAQSRAGAGVATTKDVARRARADWERGWRQFRLLSLRYIELLINDRVNLLILLLQAPIIAIMLVLMLRFEVGAGIFNATTLTQCRTQIITATGPLALPQAQSTELINCQQVSDFLKNTASGQAYALQQGGASRALQHFIVPGTGTDAQKALFIMAFATILFGCINGAREFVKEAAIYRRERTVNLGILPYMFSKIAVLGLLCLFQSAALTLIVQLGEPLQQGIMLPPVVETYITLALTSLAGLMIGLTISAVAPNTDRAISFVPLVLLPQVIFSGAIIPLKDWLTQVVATIFPSRWAMAGLGSSIGLHAETVGGDRLFGSDYTYHGTLFSIYSQSDAIHRLALSWGALMALNVILMVLIGVFLKRKDAQH